MFTWISDSLAEIESTAKEMTAVNAGVHELAGVRLPLQPYTGGHAVFMYSTAADGNVTLQLRDSDDLERSGGLASMLARLQESDAATLSISYQDTDILSDGSIDVLLGAGTANLQGTGGTESVTATFDLFDSSSGHDLTLSPQTFTNSTEAFINDNSNSLGVPAETETGANGDEVKKTGAQAEAVKLSVKRARPKATSPNRQGPQQCQVCSKVFGNASALAKHKLTHSDERKYVCTMCGKAFKRQDHLNGHMLTHRNKKPYECKAEGCGKSYCDARSLRRHTENHHSGSAVSSTTTTLSPAQGAASGDAASPHGSSCIQYAPPPTTQASTGKSQLQQLLATEPVKSANGGNNDGLTKQQLDLIHQIMEQTQRQSQPAPKPAPSKPAGKPAPKQPAKVQRVWTNTSQPSTTNSKTTSVSTVTVTKSTTNVTTATTSSVSGGVATVVTTSLAGPVVKTELKPVECNLCHRKFKNIPALNGHMRLHGGYFKKDSENKKSEKKENTGPPLQTASVSVRALIEEKIISKRITTNTQTSTTTTQQISTPTGDSNSSQNGSNPTTNAPPLYPLTTVPHSTDAETKISSFVVPAPPQQTNSEKISRRHSDAETFTVPRVPGTTPQQEAEALADLILKKSKVAVKRATSDPGQSPQQLQIQFQGDAFTLASVTYQSEDGGYFSPNLQDEVFQQVQDTMLLQGVDAQQLASIQLQAASLLQEQDEQLQDIASLEDYASVTASLQEGVENTTYQPGHTVNQELQAVLDSPLPESLAEFSTYHSSPAQNFTSSPHPSLAAQSQSPLQSPLIRNDSPGFAYPTPPASHEGPSPVFAQNSMLPMISPQQNEFKSEIPDEPPQASSPLTAAFFTSTMSSAAAVEEALEEVLPGESLPPDDIYTSLSNSPPPQSPGVAMTPVASPITTIPTTTAVSTPVSHPVNTFTPAGNNLTFPLSPHYTLQSQMMPNSDDPLLSSSPKDFASRKKFDFTALQSVKIIGNGLIDFGNPNLAGILVDNNGELKFIQTSGSPINAKNIILTNVATHNLIAAKELDVKPLLLSTQNQILHKTQKISKTTQCAMVPTNNKITNGTNGLSNVVNNINPGNQVSPVSVAPGAPVTPGNALKTKMPVPVENIKQEEGTDVFLSPNVIPASPNRMSRKRPRTEPLQLPTVYTSRLRAARGRPPGAAPYTPLPMLNPSRSGPGLFWNAKTKTTIAANLTGNSNFDSLLPGNCDSIPESDSTPHINVGPQYQCSFLPDCQSGKEKNGKDPPESLLWSPEINSMFTDNEVDMYLDFACCAAVPGGGRNKEYALHLLYLCGGNIHEAMVKLMQPTPYLPPEHPLLNYQYSDSEQWSAVETESFHRALDKFDKDFFKIAHEVGTKSVKQCVQFYYVWKKVCSDEYRRIKIHREHRIGFCRSHSDNDFEDRPCPDSKLLGIAETESPITAPDHKHFSCEFHDCSASFNSRAALNGHIRIHGGTVRRSPTPTLNMLEKRPFTHHTLSSSLDITDQYPCKICGKKFSKIKSRSAHMKSHRPPDAEQKKKQEVTGFTGTGTDQTISNS